MISKVESPSWRLRGMVQNIGSLGSHDAFHRIFHSPSALAAENCMQSSRQSQGIGGFLKRGHYASCFSNHGTFWSTLYGDEWWRGWGGGVLCRHLWFHTRCQQYVNNLSLSNLWKRGAPAFVFAFTFSYESPASYCTCYSQLEWLGPFCFEYGFLDVFLVSYRLCVFLGERLIDNLYPHKLGWIFRDSWNSIFNVLHLSPFVFLVPLLRPGWVAALPFWLSLAACGWEVSCPKSMRSWSFDGHKPGASRFLGGDLLYLGLCESYFDEVFWLLLWAKLSCMTTPEEQVSWLCICTHDSLMCRGVEQAGKGCV